MIKKKWNKIRLVLVLMLVFMLALNNVSAGTLLTEQPLSENQTTENDSEKNMKEIAEKPITEDEEAITKTSKSSKNDEENIKEDEETNNGESAAEQQNNSKYEETSIKKVIAKADDPITKAELLLNDAGWGSKVSAYTFSPSVVLPANSTENTLEIILPKYIIVATAPTPDEVMTNFEEIPMADGTTKIIMKLADSSSAGTLMGKSIYLSQSEFIKQARIDSYGISVTFTNAQKAKINAEKVYSNVAIDFNKSINVYFQVPKLFFPTLEDYTYSAEFDYPYDLQEVDYTGTITLDKKVFEYMKLKDNSEMKMNSDGTASMPLNDAMKIANNKLMIEFPIEVDPSRVPEDWPLTRYKFPISGFLTSNSGKTYRFTREIWNNYLDVNQYAPDNVSFPPIFEMIQKNYNGAGVLHFQRLYPNLGGQYDAPKNVVEKYSEHLKLSFIIPEFMEWYGDPSQYDSDTRRVTLGAEFFGFEKTLLEQKNVFNFKQAVPFRIKYDFNNRTNNLDPAKKICSYLVSDIEVGVTINNKTITKKIDKKNCTLDKDVSYIDKGSKHLIRVQTGNDTKLKQGTKDVVIYDGSFYFSKYDADKTYPASEISFDLSNNLEPKKDKMYSDLLHINRIEFNKKNIDALPENSNLKFFYKTNVGDTIHEVTVFDNIELNKDEYITWFKFKTDVINNYVNESEFFKMYGDVIDLGIPPSPYSKYNLFSDSLSKIQLASESDDSSFYNPGVKFDERYYYLYPSSKIDISSNNAGWLVPGVLNDKIRMQIKPFEDVNTVKILKLKLNEDLKEIQLNSIKTDNKLIKIASASYTTTKSNDTQTVADIGEIILGENEYFTSLDLTLDTTNHNGSSYGSYSFINLGLFSPLKYAPSQDVDLSDTTLFHIIETDDIAEGNWNLKSITLKSKNSFKQSTLALVKDGRLDALNTGDLVTIPFLLTSTTSSAMGKDDIDYNVITNPTYYVPIPDDFEFSNVSFTGKMQGKTPETKVFLGEDGKTSYLRVRFYGTPDSATGFKGTIDQNIEMHVNCKVKKFAKPGFRSLKINSYTNLQDSFIALQDKESLIEGEYYIGAFKYNNGGVSHNPNYSSANIYDPYLDLNVSAVKMVNSDYNGSIWIDRIEYTVLQNQQITIDANVKKDNDTLLEKNVNIRSNEPFNAHVDIWNGGATAMNKFVMYVPVPQGDANSWRAKLLQAGIDSTGTVDVFVSEDANPTMKELDNLSDSTGMYKSLDSVSDLSQVTMIKLKSDTIPNGQYISLKGRFTNYDTNKDGSPRQTSTKIEYAYTLSTGRVRNSATVTATINNTILKGKVFIDANEDGVMNDNEKALSGKKVSLYDKNDTLIKTTTSQVDGMYNFDIPELSEGDYLKIEKATGYIATKANNLEVAGNLRSYFDEETGKAIPNLKNAEYLNAGFIEAPDINVLDNPYTIRINKTATIQYNISNQSKRNVKFESQNTDIATVDESSGLVTGIKEGTAKIRLYYMTDKGTVVNAYADIIVESNDAPVITAPDTVTMNVNDLWEPRDPSIIEGLNLTDDHDSVTISNLDIEDNVPVGKRFLFFFKTANTDKIQQAGTYSLKYSYTDQDGNKTEKIVKVKVNGQPYLSDLDGKKLTEDNMPYYYFRLGTSLDPFQDVKAYYEKAGDNIDDQTVATEISKDDINTGVFQLGQAVDSNGNAVVGSPYSAGVYTGTYYIRTPSEAKSVAEVSLERKLYAQGMIEFNGHNIAYPASSDIHSYKTWDDFYKVYKEKLNLSAKLLTPKENGDLVEKDILGTVKAINPKTNQEVDFNTYDFSLPEGQTSKNITLTLRVYDDGKAQWNPSLGSVYGEDYKDIDIIVTVQQYVGDVPHIHFTDIERVTTDQIRDATTSQPEKDLSTDEAMDEAEKSGQHPLRDRLMNDVTFSDPNGTIKERELVSIKRASHNPNKPAGKTSYSPNIESEIREMMQTVGTYKLMYRTMDNDNNQIFAERTVYVSGPTVFVKHMSDLNTQPDTEVNILKSSSVYTPSALFAYHLDYDEVTKHQTSVIADKQSMDIKTPGTQEVVYKTSHHFTTYPDNTTARPNDTFKVTIKVHGSPEFNKIDGETESLFVDQTALLDDVTATFAKASDKVGDPAVTVPLTVTNNQSENQLTSSSATSIDVIFSADASVQSGVTGNTASLQRTYEFYGLPQIKAQDSLRVKADITEEELKTAIAAEGVIVMPDGIEHTLKLQYDFSDMHSNNPSVLLKTDYTLANGTKRTAEKIVKLEKVDKPILQAEDIIYNVGYSLNILTDGKVEGTYDGKKIELSDISYNSFIVPVDAEGKVNKPASYKVTLRFEDTTTGNSVEKDILVKVNGLPVLHNIEELEKRVGDDIDIFQKAYVTWMKAPDTEGAATEERFDYSNVSTIPGAKFELINMKNEITKKPVDFSALNEAGYYSGDYYAMTPTGGEVTEKHTLLLHGKPVLESEGTLNLSKNVKRPDDFLAAYEDRLGLKASVQRAYTDKQVDTIDLTSKITITEDELNKIKYEAVGNYEIEISVTDTIDVAGSKYNTTTKKIMVNIVETDGTPPIITTPVSVQRVVNDKIGANDSGANDVAKYLLGKAKYEEVDGNNIINKEIVSINMVKGPNVETFKKIDNPNNDALKTIMNTVGEYEAVIEVTDEKSNKVQAVLKIEVAGTTEFGYDKEGVFVKLDDVLNVRQGDEKYSFEGIYARHMDPSGTYHRVGINKPADVDVTTVSVKNLTIEAPHHYPYYDDDPSKPRGNDTFSYELLVQGKINIFNAEDIYTRVGTNVDPLKNIVSENDTKDVYAEFVMIDKNGNTHIEKIIPTSTFADTSTVGERSVTITAKDEMSGANDNTVTKKRSLYVYSVPNISYNEQFNVGMDANEIDLKNGLSAQIKYKDIHNQNLYVPEGDITINYSEVLSEIKKNGAGKKYPLTISVKYLDNGIEKTITKTANVYVLNEPSAIIEIPKYLNLKDEEGTNQISTKATVSLYQGADMDNDKDSVPAINITVDKEIELSKGSASFKAYSYNNDHMLYDGVNPIMQLKYGVTESDHFYLKADKADIDAKNIGLYQGVLNFTMEYEGD